MNALYEERLKRIRNAVALKPVDKVPIAPCANGFFANTEGITYAKYIFDHEAACTAALNTFEKLGGVDATQAYIFSPYFLPLNWMSNVVVPGADLPDDAPWQVLEVELLTRDDYDTILRDGFGAFQKNFFETRLTVNLFEKLEPILTYMPTAAARHTEAGIPCICDFIMAQPFELFCGGRGLEAFFCQDLFEIPDKLDKVFETTMEFMLADYRQRFEATRPVGVWIGGWRSATELISPQIWDRFVWPYMKRYAELCLEYDVLPIFHLDSRWDRGIERFRELPAGKCVMSLDGTTDIFRAKKVIGDRMCIMGDVRADLLTFGAPEEVYQYAKKLIDAIGREGFILASGCDIPVDAKFENVRAMARAAEETRR